MYDPLAAADLWVQDRGKSRPSLLHHYRDCVPGLVFARKGVVRDSECSGPYAVESGPPWVMLGDVCRRCRRRFVAERDIQV